MTASNQQEIGRMHVIPKYGVIEEDQFVGPRNHRTLTH